MADPVVCPSCRGLYGDGKYGIMVRASHKRAFETSAGVREVFAEAEVAASKFCTVEQATQMTRMNQYWCDASRDSQARCLVHLTVASLETEDQPETKALSEYWRRYSKFAVDDLWGAGRCSRMVPVLDE